MGLAKEVSQIRLPHRSKLRHRLAGRSHLAGEGDRYDTSIAATVIEAKWAIYLPIYRQQDLFASSGWTPSRSTLLNLIRQAEFVLESLADYMTQLVRQDMGIGLYIKDVLDQLLAGCTDYASLLPDQWKQRHPEAIRQYRQEERRDKAERKQYRAAKRRLARI